MPDIERALRRRPPPQALDWVRAHAPPGATISSVRRLRAGTAAATHAVNLRTADGASIRYVLRRYLRRDWLRLEPDLAEREDRILHLLDPSPLPTPQPIAVDPAGEICDAPAVLMTRLPGRLDIDPPDLDTYLARLAAPLPAVHAISVDAEFRRSYPYRVWNPEPSIPTWTRQRRAWRTVLAEAVAAPPPARPFFIHRDYHPGNVIWLRGRLTGLVDWVNACWGPAGLDVAHCRVNLTVLFGLAAAERFLDLYRALPEAQPYHPHWDCRDLADMLPGPHNPAQWHDAGRTDLTADLTIRRLDDYAVSLARRLG